VASSSGQSSTGGATGTVSTGNNGGNIGFGGSVSTGGAIPPRGPTPCFLHGGVISSIHDREQRVLILAGNACPETQVDLIAPCRGFDVNKKPAVAVGVAVRIVLEHFQKHLRSKPA